MNPPAGTEYLTVRKDKRGLLSICPDRQKPGTVGLCPRHQARLAHDLLEHVNGLQLIGSWEDELEATGSFWFTRGFPGAFLCKTIERVVYDLQRGPLIARIMRGKPLRASPTFIEPAQDCEALHELNRGLARACAFFGRAGEGYYLPARNYISRGYWTTVQRWNGDRLAANRQFEAITCAGIPWLHEMADHKLPEGARLVLTYGNGKATMERLN